MNAGDLCFVCADYSQLAKPLEAPPRGFEWQRLEDGAWELHSTAQTPSLSGQKVEDRKTETGEEEDDGDDEAEGIHTQLRSRRASTPGSYLAPKGVMQVATEIQRPRGARFPASKGLVAFINRCYGNVGSCPCTSQCSVP